jgi:hypothetical protein
MPTTQDNTVPAYVAKHPIVHQWIPYFAIWFREGREEWYVHSPRATYAQLVQAREGAAADQARAKKRLQFRAWLGHTERVEMLKRVLDAFGPLMAQYPTMSLAEACGDPLPSGVTPVLTPEVAGALQEQGRPHPLRVVKEL